MKIFEAQITTQKKTQLSESPISENIKKNAQNKHLRKKLYVFFFQFLLVFSQMGLCRELKCLKKNKKNSLIKEEEKINGPEEPFE